MARYNHLQFPPNGSSGLIGINVTHIHVRCGGLFVFGYSFCQSCRQVCGLGEHCRQERHGLLQSPLNGSSGLHVDDTHTYTCMVWWTVLCLGAVAVNQA